MVANEEIMKKLIKITFIFTVIIQPCFTQQSETILDALTHFSNDQSPIGKIFLDMSEDTEGNMWFITYDVTPTLKRKFNLSKFDGENWTRHTKDDGLATNKFSALQCDSRGNVWVATSGGICKYDGTNWDLTTTKKEFLLVNTKIIFEELAGPLLPLIT